MSTKYICKSCGGVMEFEDEWEDILVCPSCGDSVELDRYGLTDEEYDAMFPTYEEVTGEYGDEDDEDDDGEIYDPEFDELDD